MNKIVSLKLQISKSQYKIIITDENPFLTLTKQIKNMDYSSLIIVTNKVVWALYARFIDAAFNKKRLSYNVFVLADGEKYKNLNTVQTIYKRLLRFGADRSSILVSIGGGVTGDIAGFVASTYMRGIRLVQVPTTLLAQVDAAIGGKTGVDFSLIKNIIGTFYQPALVYSNVNFLQTLKKRIYISGLAEVIKYGIIKDKRLFSYIESNKNSIVKRSNKVLLDIVYSSSCAKVWFVEKDEKEVTGIRTILNFGHTFAHAIETISNFKIMHGEAVGMGMVIAAKISRMLNLCKEDVPERIVELIKAIGLPVYRNFFKINELSKTINYDKKSQAKLINLVLLKDIGEPLVYRIDKKNLEKLMMEVKNED